VGRDLIPKIGEWRDGKLYAFRSVNSMSKDDSPPKPDDGRMIVYEVQHGKDGEVEVLGTAFADGFQAVMAAFWEAGYQHGRRDGRKEKLQEIQAALASS
jgi:hypothetical protein